MMRFQAALSAGLATFLVVPAVALGTDEVGTLREALTNTQRALELLAGVQKKIETGEPGAPSLVLSVTEDPILDARRRDERLETLRNEVGLLQTELELLEGAAPPASVPTTTPPPTVPPSTPAPGPALVDPKPGAGAKSPRAHTGLDDATRRVLLGRDPVADDDAMSAPKPGPAAPAKTDPGVPPKPSPEGPTYSANPVLQARACFRAGRFQQGADLLQGDRADPKALYWRARCYEKLDRLDEAAADLQRVLELTKDEFEVRRAQTDLQFIEWKKEFVDELEKKQGSGKKN